MPQRFTLLLLIAGVLTPSFALAQHSPIPAVEPFQQPLLNVQQRRRLEGKLEQRVNCHFHNTPLDQVVRKLASSLGESIQIDTPALEEVGFSPAEPVTLSLVNVRLRTALDLMLGELELVYQLDEAQLVVTTPEAAEGDLKTIQYPCSDLLDYSGKGPADFDSLIQVVTCVIEPEGWKELGGPGTAQPQGDALVISQTDAIHFKIQQLLAALRRAKAIPSERYDPSPIEPGVQQAESAQIQRQLAVQLLNLQFDQLPLQQVIDLLQQRTKVQFVIDRRALEDVGLTPGVLVSGYWRQASAAMVLKDICSQLELTPLQCDDVLKITTPEEAESKLVLKVYPVRDFVGPSGSTAMRGHFSMYSFCDELIQAITTTIEPESWEELGGPGVIQPFAIAESLVVSTTEEIHRKIDELLLQVRKQRQKPIHRQQNQMPQTSSPQFTYRQIPTTTAALVDQTYKINGQISEQQLAEIAQKLRDRVSYGNWDGQKVYIRTLGANQLVVRNSASAQRSIRDVLPQILAEAGYASPLTTPAPVIEPKIMGGGGFFSVGDR